jgi:hypothetical protein
VVHNLGVTSPDQEPLAQSLDDIARHGARGNGIAAVFRAGLTGGEHRWELRSAAGDLLAVTARVHTGGRGARAFWKLLTLTGMDAGNDIHVELRGAQGRVLARITSANDAPATVTVLDDAGALVATSRRDKTLLLKVKHPDTFVVMDADDHIVASVDCEADQPWPVVDGDGALVGELVAGKPGPTLSPSWSDWIDPTWALSVATYANAQHLGIAGAQQYTAVVHAEAPEGRSVATALLPLIAGLSY